MLKCEFSQPLGPIQLRGISWLCLENFPSSNLREPTCLCKFKVHDMNLSHIAFAFILLLLIFGCKSKACIHSLCKNGNVRDGADSIITDGVIFHPGPYFVFIKLYSFSFFLIRRIYSLHWWIRCDNSK
jgi:hypothetical protein